MTQKDQIAALEQQADQQAARIDQLEKKLAQVASAPSAPAPGKPGNERFKVSTVGEHIANQRDQQPR
jgi:hypothetical protein